MPSFVTPKKNTQFIFYISLVSQTDTKLMQVNPTIAAGDFKVATDDGAPGNLGTIPVVDADFTKRVKVTLSTGEMNGDNVTFIASDAAGSEWCDLTINLQTTANQIDDIPTTAEFEARTIVSADYVVVGDTIARVTLVDTTTANSDLVTASAIKTAIEADASDLSSIMEALVNKMIITEANGNTEMFNDAGASQGSVASAFTSVAGETIRLRMFK